MAITESCILLPLWKQETHDGTDVPECQLPILSLWRFLLSEQDKRERLGGVYLSAFRIYRQAYINGVHTGFIQTAILETYRLGTAANVTRLKKSLMVKDLITIPVPKHLEMSDPILALWLKRRVWKES